MRVGAGRLRVQTRESNLKFALSAARESAAGSSHSRAGEWWEGDLGAPHAGLSQASAQLPLRRPPTLVVHPHGGHFGERGSQAASTSCLGTDLPPLPAGADRGAARRGTGSGTWWARRTLSTFPPRFAQSRESSSDVHAWYLPKNTPSFRNCGSSAGSGLRGGEAGGEEADWGSGGGAGWRSAPVPGPAGAQCTGTCSSVQKRLAPSPSCLPSGPVPVLPSRALLSG